VSRKAWHPPHSAAGRSLHGPFGRPLIASKVSEKFREPGCTWRRSPRRASQIWSEAAALRRLLSAALLLPVTPRRKGFSPPGSHCSFERPSWARGAGPAAEALLRAGSSGVRPCSLLALLRARRGPGRRARLPRGRWRWSPSVSLGDVAARTTVDDGLTGGGCPPRGWPRERRRVLACYCSWPPRRSRAALPRARRREALVGRCARWSRARRASLRCRGSTASSQEYALTSGEDRLPLRLVRRGRGAGCARAALGGAVAARFRAAGGLGRSRSRTTCSIRGRTRALLGKAVPCRPSRRQAELPLAIRSSGLPVLRDEMGSFLPSQGAEANLQHSRRARLRGGSCTDRRARGGPLIADGSATPRSSAGGRSRRV